MTQPSLPAGVCSAVIAPTNKRHPSRTLSKFIRIRLADMDSSARALAIQRGMTLTALVRSALEPLLLGLPRDLPAVDCRYAEPGERSIQIKVKVERRHSFLMSQNAKAAGMFNGEYLGALIDGADVSPLPKNYDDLKVELLASTDQLASTSLDLQLCLRQLRSESSPHLESLRSQLADCIREVRAHLALASQLAAALQHTRKPR